MLLYYKHGNNDKDYDLIKFKRLRAVVNIDMVTVDHTSLHYLADTISKPYFSCYWQGGRHGKQIRMKCEWDWGNLHKHRDTDRLTVPDRLEFLKTRWTSHWAQEGNKTRKFSNYEDKYFYNKWQSMWRCLQNMH